MTKLDYNYWKAFREDKKSYLTNDEYRIVCELHAKYFRHDVVYPCKCNPKIIQSYIDDLNEHFNSIGK